MYVYVSICECVLHMCAHVCMYVMCPYMIYILLIDCAENILKFCFIKKNFVLLILLSFNSIEKVQSTNNMIMNSMTIL